MSNKEQEKGLSFLEILVGVIAVIGFIFFIGELFRDKEDDKLKEAKPKPEQIPQPENENVLEKKIQRLNVVDEQISELTPKRKRAIKAEKRILIWARIVIAFGFVLLNIWYYITFNRSMFDLGNQMNINGVVVMLYSFIAFVIHGTPEKFIRNIKLNTKIYLRRKHLPLLSELKSLENEREQLLKEIELLEQNQEPIAIEAETIKELQVNPN